MLKVTEVHNKVQSTHECNGAVDCILQLDGLQQPGLIKNSFDCIGIRGEKEKKAEYKEQLGEKAKKAEYKEQHTSVAVWHDNF